MADQSHRRCRLQDTNRPFRASQRALVPVVGKTLEAAVVVLFISLLTTVLFGGVVPDHRDAVGHELADRTLSTAVEGVETTATVPDAAVRGTRRAAVDLPRSIHGSAYRIDYVPNATLATDPNVTAPALVLDHPTDAFDRTLPVTLPASVNVTGTWDSGTDCVARVVVGGDETTLELSNGRRQ
ncbi:hypothetical protein C440_16509 [Haloferax mucosum ATCC BAA-1512]|uniref:Uncharacterized protein n=1 Tax=Haloferax mucosum ATCC BAA-1512 TaxID=662479 RepID=M0I7G7_9EURY|nr:hypothetical protein [Haloferax mucosum]ELZ91932.1 hypothetical protein C440_16509 [Haloferax mucosum ATCC BAA-1512]